MEDSQRELSLFLAMGRGDQSHPTTGTDNDFPVFSDRHMCLSPGWNTHFHCVWLVFTQHMYVCGTENGKIVVGAGSWDNINFKWQWDLFCIFMCHSIPCLVSQIPLHSFQVFRFSCCQVVGLSGLILGAWWITLVLLSRFIGENDNLSCLCSKVCLQQQPHHLHHWH